MTRLIFTLIAVAFVGMFSGITFAQDAPLNGGTLRGKITDATPEQKPIEGVEVKIVTQDGTEFTTKTDANGDYKKAGIPAGRYLINISKEGYGKRIGKPVTIVNGGDHFVLLKMSKMGVPHVEAQPSRMDAVVKVRIASLLERVTESVGKRYNLDEGSVKALHKSILDSIDSVLSQTESRSAFARAMGKGNAVLLNMLLARPEFQGSVHRTLDRSATSGLFGLCSGETTAAGSTCSCTSIYNGATFDKELSLTPDATRKGSAIAAG